MGDLAMAAAYAPQADELGPERPELIAAHVVPVDRAQRRLLYAGRILVTGGWLVLTNTTISNHTTNPEHALFGLALLLLGMFLIMLSPVANQFPGAAGAGAAVADAVLFYFFAPAAN